MTRHAQLAVSLLFGAALALAAAGAGAQGATLADAHGVPPALPTRTALRDPVVHLLQRVARSEITLAGSDLEILQSVLRELTIPIASQVVVFSRTSLQGGLIRPANPRAIYFSESAYVGWVPGGLIEVAAIDPEAGPVFYGFDPQDARDARRTLVRETSCLRCHASPAGRDVPELFARSLMTDVNGEPLAEREAFDVTDETPFDRRWGGWYVTGYRGEPSHQGNAFAAERDGQIHFQPSAERPLELPGAFDTSRYPAPTSDVLALLIFEHQMAMQNSLTRAAHRGRRILAAQRRPTASTQESSAGEWDGIVEDVLDHLLFRQAAPLPAGIQGHAAFRDAFAAGARRSGRGDALKDLSLRGRLFANRCSFLIYSDAFGALPLPLKDRILGRLHAVLHEDDPHGRYAYLEADEKRRILEILNETHPDARRHFQGLPTADSGPRP